MRIKRKEIRQSASRPGCADRQLHAMLKISGEVLDRTELDVILSSITAELHCLMHFDRSSVALLSPDQNCLVLREVFVEHNDEVKNYDKGTRIPLEPTNVVGWVAINGKAVMRSDIEGDNRFREIAEKEKLKSDIIVPLVTKDGLIGTLNAGSRRKDYFSQADLEMMKNFGNFACIAVEYAKLLRDARELSERHELLRRSANDGVLLLDKKTGKIREANEKTKTILGYEQKELMRKSYIDLFAKEDLYQARRDFINILSKKSLSFLDRRMLSKSNRIVFVDIHASLLDINKNAFIQIVIQDISQRKMLEEQIIAQNKRLEQVNLKLREVDRLKTEFLANISHELRTPLSVIIAYSESLKAENISREEQREFLKVITENGKSLLGLINDLLDLSKLEVSGAMLNVTLSHIHDVIKSVLSTKQKQADSKHVSLSFQPAEDIPVAYFDNYQISKVLSCLVQNAIKFTDSGGNVKVTTRLQDNEILVKISDTGAGIPCDAIPHIFSTFHQVDGSSSRKWGGLGIGLALVKHLIDLHKGRLWVESEVGSGSQFTFSLPLGTEVTFQADEKHTIPDLLSINES
jgi:PAS domain S-box-containing protein